MIDTDTLVCGVEGCEWTPKATVKNKQQGLSMHRSKTHGIPGPSRSNRSGPPKPPNERNERAKSLRREIRISHDLAVVVQMLYPKGIPTADVDELSMVLAEVSILRERLAAS